MKSVSFYSSHVLLAVHLVSWFTTNQVRGTQLSCGNDEIGYFRIVSDESNSDTSQLIGRVEICYVPPSGSPRDWYSVCGDNNWNNDTAAVVCEHLGFSDTGSLATFGSDGDGQVANCTELGRLASDCNEIANENCNQGARIQCEPARCRNGEIRLRNGDTNQTLQGLVEICFNQQWGTIDLNEWGNADANVACGQLGFSNEGATGSNTGFEFGTGPIFFRGFRCDGKEESLLECRKMTDGRNDHNADARVSCMPAPCADGEVRLVNGTQSVEGRATKGRVEVCINGRWGSVCDDNWDAVDARVVCNQLAFLTKGAIAVQQSAFGEPVIDHIYGVQCDEMTETLMECDFTTQGRASCSHMETAGVFCKACTNGDLRLVNGSREEEGRVEVCINQHWSSVCDHLWSEADAMVTCRQLGYSDTIATSTSFGRGEGTIYFSNFECIGMESSLLSCDVSDLRACDHSMDVGVICSVEQGVKSSTTIMETTSTESTEPIVSERQQGTQSDSLVAAVAVLGVISGVLLVALVIVIIGCIILVKRSATVRDSTNKQKYPEARDLYEHELDNPVYGEGYDESPTPLQSEYDSVANSEPKYDSVH